MRIGIDIGGTKIEGIVLADNGLELARERVATPAGTYEATIASIQALVIRLESGVGARCSVGVATPGAVSPATGLIKNANSTRLIGHTLDRDLATALGRPVRVANDANCFAVSEATDGAAAGAEVVFGVILGTGVGGGIAVKGRPLLGANAIAGEWGHNPLPVPADDERPGPTCYCGRQGCIEAWLSGPAFERQYRDLAGGDLRATDIADAAGAGSAPAAACLEVYCERLARSLAGVVNLIDPDVIVLGGGLSRIAALYERVPELWARYVFSEPEHIRTRLVPPRYGDSSGVRGAAWLWPAEPSGPT
jgi:fructokinase